MNTNSLVEEADENLSSNIARIEFLEHIRAGEAVMPPHQADFGHCGQQEARGKLR